MKRRRLLPLAVTLGLVLLLACLLPLLGAGAAEQTPAFQNTASGKTYQSLASALSEAADGQTLLQLRDVTEAGQIKNIAATGKVTVKGEARYRLTFSYTATNDFWRNSAQSVCFENLDITAAKGFRPDVAGVTLSFVNCTVKGGSSWFLCWDKASGSLVLKDSTLTCLTNGNHVLVSNAGNTTHSILLDNSEIVLGGNSNMLFRSGTAGMQLNVSLENGSSIVSNSQNSYAGGAALFHVGQGAVSLTLDGGSSLTLNCASNQSAVFVPNEDCTLQMPNGSIFVTRRAMQAGVCLPERLAASQSILGWQSAEGLLPSYMTAGCFDADSVSLTPLVTDSSRFVTEAGASVRTEAPYGIRFTVDVDPSLIDELEGLGYTVGFGAIVAPADALSGSFFAKECLPEGDYADTSAVGFRWAEKGSTVWKYRAVLVDLPASFDASQRSIAARGYMTLSKDGKTVTAYTPYSAVDHVRTLAFVARAAHEAGIAGDALETVLSTVGYHFPAFASLSPVGTVETSENCFLRVCQNADGEDLSSCLAAIAEDGYTLYAENSLEANRFYTYTKGDLILTVSYLPAAGELRLISESSRKTALPPKASDEVVRICDTLLLQVGLNYDYGYLEGICDLVRLSDGSFVILDGGHGLQKNADRLYEVMRRLAPNPENIVVSAWVLSHGHSDHIGMFDLFLNTYADRVTVKSFVCNIPTDEVCASLSEGAGYWTRAEAAIRSKCPNAEVIRAHAGQELYFGNAKLTVLYTHELLAPTDPLDWYNSTSLVLMLEAEDVKALLPTDAGIAVAECMLTHYTSATLGADILQVAHHGIVNTAHELYPVADPTYVLWPMGTGELSRRVDENGNFTSADCAINLKKDFNMFFWNSPKCKENIFVANDDIYVLTLWRGNVSVEFYENDLDFYNDRTGEVLLPAPEQWFSQY